MISVTFIFKQSHSDAEFQRLDHLIEAQVFSHSEYKGKDSWSNDATGLQAVVYYFETLKGLEMLRSLPDHKEAKSQYKKWYDGYHVVVAEILDAYGDGNIAHNTSNWRK